VSIEAAVNAAYALGALALAGEAAVHVQQYATFIHTVRWIGPLTSALAGVALARGSATRPRRWRANDERTDDLRFPIGLLPTPREKSA
jgi:hypothetical protein